MDSRSTNKPMSFFSFFKIPSKADSPTNTAMRIPSLDGLRAVSISLVLAGHLTHNKSEASWLKTVYEQFQLGWLGVTIFFVISGFLITTLLLREKTRFHGKVDIRSFYIRRVLRIFPVFYLYVAVVYLLHLAGVESVPTQDFIRALTYTANLGMGAWVLGHAWTLAVEEQFYLFWPWLVRLSSQWMAGAAVVMILYAAMAHEIAYRWPFLEGYMLLPFLKGVDCLMIGALLGFALHRFPRLQQNVLFRKTSLRLLVLGLLLTFRYLAYNGAMPQGEFAGKFIRPFTDTFSAVCIGYLLVSCMTTQGDRCFKLLNHPVAVHFGVLSYSLYVWQQLFLDNQASGVWWRTFPANLFCAYAAAYLSYSFWERPILNWRDQFKRV